MGRATAGVVAALLAVATADCSGPGGDQRAGAAPEFGASSVEVLISTADGTIGEIADLIVAEDGTVYAVDRQASMVHVVDESGARLVSLGRPGAGPREFSQPTTLEVRGDTLFVVDWGNARLQAISTTGTHILTRPLPPGQAPSIGAGTRFVRPTWGIDTMLAVIHRPDLSTIAAIGRIVGSPTNMVSPRLMKEQIREGGVPNVFLNAAEAVIGADSSTWMYVPARGTVQRFDAEGVERWTAELNEPEQEDLFSAFLSKNAAKPSGSFFLLRYVLDVTLVGDQAWLLLGSSLAGQAAVRILESDGTFGGRREFPGVVGVDEIAVDPVRGYVYFARPDDAELVRVRWRPAF